MAITVNEVQVTWSASSSVSVSAGGNQTSDVATIDQTCFQATIMLKADNGGTPAAGDTVSFYLLASLGDPDGASTAEYGTTVQDIPLGTLDTNADDPAIMTVTIPMPLVTCKVYAVSGASSNSITVSATILEQRG
jgi:hypothetical protein